MTERPRRTTAERTATLRSALRDALKGDEDQSIRDLSQALGASERDVVAHLDHLERSLSHHGERLLITPAHCVACGFKFEDRPRLSKPSRCPRCRATRISPPRFRIV